MNIGLIAMSGVRVKTAELAALGVTLPGFVNRGKVIASLPSLGLLVVAALTPPEHEVSYLEIADIRQVASLPDFDLVGISSFTAQIDEAYAVADQYRARGTTVVLGGTHVTLLPDEALQHADAVVWGGAEDTWPQLLNDYAAGTLKARYRGSNRGFYTEVDPILPRFELLVGRPYNRITIQTSRGCPLDCDFCAESKIFTPRFDQKPVAAVEKELKRIVQLFDRPFLEFADDNTFVNRSWSKEFLRMLAPCGLRWFTETDLRVADDAELPGLLYGAGCYQVLIGLESPRGESLEGIERSNWKAKRRGDYLRAIERLQSAGVTVNGCFIVGLDSDTPDIFEEIRDFVRESGLLEVQVTVLTPFPGTRLYDRLRTEHRLLQERFWDRCTLFDVTFRPKQMTVDELEAGLRWLFTELYTEEMLHNRRRRYIDIIKALPERAEADA
ncbi:MAG: B12-binding domain-containing radical SAM protein [Gemmatimonadetes bacterium]|nr:B12-binding domain-containing radical SAM protein [Gemmatimonadota bacterium]